jgi:hypothetical protein
MILFREMSAYVAQWKLGMDEDEMGYRKAEV